MSELNFSVDHSSDCSEICISPCDTYCTQGDIATIEYAKAKISFVKWESFSPNSGRLTVTASNSFTTGTITAYNWSIRHVPTGTVTILPLTQTISHILNPGLYHINLSLSTSAGTIGLISFSTGFVNAEIDIYTKRLSITTGNGYYAFPAINVNTTGFPYMYFTDNSELGGSASVEISDELRISQNGLGTLTLITDSLPQDYTIVSPGNRNYTLAYIYKPNSTLHSNDWVEHAITMQTTLVGQTCADELTLTDVDSITLYITTPSGTELDAHDIKERYLEQVEFSIEAEDVGLSSFGENGLWEFKVIYQKTDGSIYQFIKCIEKYLYCNILTRYQDKLFSQIDPACNCDEQSLEQVIETGIYIDALKNSADCKDKRRTEKLIDIIDIRLNNKNKNCDC